MQRILPVLVVLMIIFTLLLGNSIAAEKVKGKKEKSQTSQQKQTPMEEEPIGKYDHNPVDLAATILPKNYTGHDLKSIYEALEKRKISARKDEYETIEQYKQRIQDSENKPLLGKLDLNDLFSFVVTPTSSYYSADLKTLTLWVRADVVLDGVSIDSSMVGIVGPNLYSNTSTYIGSNAYGALTEVEKIRGTYVYLAFSNKSALPLISQEYGFGNFKLELGNITPEIAKAIRENLYIAFIYKLKEPYLRDGFVSQEPTRDDPKDYFWVHKNVHAISKEIWVFNKTNGEILLKVKTGE